MASIRPDEQVYIVDYSISPEEMRALLIITKNVTWIDHHKTAIDKYENFEYDIRGIRRDGVAACMLTYCYIHHMTERGDGEIKPFDLSMIEDAPKFTKLIADWDVWAFKYGDDTRNFITGFNSFEFAPEGRDWDKFHTNRSRYLEDGDLIWQGQIMNAYRDGWAKSYMDQFGFETEFEGFKFFAANLGLCNSEYFKSLPEGMYDAFMPFAFNGDIFTVSMYSKTIDVSEIAKKHGGGGHKGAAGFQCKYLPFGKASASYEGRYPRFEARRERKHERENDEEGAKK